MIARIESRSYSYISDNVCTISATLNVYNGEMLVASTGVTAAYNLSQPDFVAEITRQITVQINAFMSKLMEVDNFRRAIFPESTDFTDAVNRILDPIETAIGGA